MFSGIGPLISTKICFQGPVSDGYTCYCTPFIERFEQKLDRNKRDLVKHLESTHGKLAHRISHLERKTRDQISSLSNSMKESIAQVNIASLGTFINDVTQRGCGGWDR